MSSKCVNCHIQVEQQFFTKQHFAGRLYKEIKARAIVWSKREELTGRLLHLHHQSLQGVQSLQLFLLILQVFLQQLGPRLNLLTVHLVGVFTCRQLSNTLYSHSICNRHHLQILKDNVWSNCRIIIQWKEQHQKKYSLLPILFERFLFLLFSGIYCAFQ